MDKNDKQEILEAINASSSATQEQFDAVQEQFDAVQEQFGAIRKEMGQMKYQILDKMSEGFADLEGSVTAALRKEDNKVNMILEILERHKVAPVDEIERIRKIKLFPTSPEIS